MSKEQYLKDINLFDNPYQNENDAKKRIRDIYLTARQGRLSEERMNMLYNLLNSIYENINQIPTRKNEYDLFALKQISTISQDIKITFGIAQKVYNLFLKDLWALNKVGRCEKNLHFPLDRKVLRFLHKSPWDAWTKIPYNEDSKNQYKSIQEILRKQVYKLGFRTPLELEQLLWHGFD